MNDEQVRAFRAGYLRAVLDTKRSIDSVLRLCTSRQEAQAVFAINAILETLGNQESLARSLIPKASGTVVSYDPIRSQAVVEFQDGSTATMWGGAFFSGLPARLPIVGDKVIADVVDGVVAAANLVS